MTDAAKFKGFLDSAEEMAAILAEAVEELAVDYAQCPPELLRQKIADILSGAYLLKSAVDGLDLGSFNALLDSLSEILERAIQGRLGVDGKIVFLLAECARNLKDAVARLREKNTPDPCAFLDALLVNIEVALSEQAREATETTRETEAPRPAAGEMTKGEAWTWNTEGVEDLVEDFGIEAREILDEFSQALLKLEGERGDAETMNRIFRAAHSLKGISAMVKVTPMEKLTHRMETLLDAVRKGRMEATPEFIDRILVSIDSLSEMLSAVMAGSPITADVEELAGILEGKAPRPSAPSGTASPLPVEAEPKGGEKTAENEIPSRRGATLRVGIEKLDEAMNLAGELATARFDVVQKIREIAEPVTELRKTAELLDTLKATTLSAPQRELLEAAGGQMAAVRKSLSSRSRQLLESGERLSKGIVELQESILMTRMVPISQIFQKLPRLVRDLARATGKRVKLTIEGAETELDKTIIERFSDPFNHLLRNAVDHGIESPEKRKASGKPEEGHIILRAAQAGDHILIEVTDDGGGIDPEKIRRTAVARGLLDEAAAKDLDDDSAIHLIFAPGFSTAATVTDLSGRGVGMDVVRDSVEALKGSIEVKSEPGVGSRFTIKLPLTLAVIAVLLVRSGRNRYAVPISAISENIHVNPEEVRAVGSSRTTSLRGETLALLPLSSVLGAGHPDAGEGDDAEELIDNPRRTLPIIVVQSMGKKVGLIVDEFLRRHEVVIKGIGSLLRRVRFAAGAAILGEGDIVIILDIPSIAKAAMTGAAQGRETAAVTPGPPAVIAENARRILVVEDSKTVRTRIRQVLEDAGYRAEEAADGAEALKKAQDDHFDLFTVDLVMPGMNGYEVTRELRRHPEYQLTPVIMVSSKGDELDRKLGFKAGIDDYISKPFAPEKLLDSVAELLK